MTQNTTITTLTTTTELVEVTRPPETPTHSDNDKRGANVKLSRLCFWLIALQYSEFQ
jgi:hypothetical protein